MTAVVRTDGKPVQSRGAVGPAGGLDVQDLRAGLGDREGRRSRLDVLHLGAVHVLDRPLVPEPWTVHTYENSYSGSESLTRATCSPTTPSTRSSRSTSARQYVWQMAHRLGVHMAPDKPVASIGLGSLAVSPLDMAAAYATFPAMGIYAKPMAITKVVLPGGKVDTASGWGKPKTKQRGLAGCCLEGQRGSPAERRVRHRCRLRRRDPSERRQDGHDREPRRRVVRRVHATAVDRRLDGVPEGRDPDARRPRSRGRRRDLPGADLARVHGCGALQPSVDRLPAAERLPDLAAADARLLRLARLRRTDDRDADDLVVVRRHDASAARTPSRREPCEPLPTIDEALALVLAEAVFLGAEAAPVGEAAGRVLAADARAVVDLPPFASSAMDGYAVRAEDTPGRLALVDDSAAGAPGAACARERRGDRHLDRRGRAGRCGRRRPVEVTGATATRSTSRLLPGWKTSGRGEAIFAPGRSWSSGYAPRPAAARGARGGRARVRRVRPASACRRARDRERAAPSGRTTRAGADLRVELDAPRGAASQCRRRAGRPRAGRRRRGGDAGGAGRGAASRRARQLGRRLDGRARPRPRGARPSSARARCSGASL